MVHCCTVECSLDCYYHPRELLSAMQDKDAGISLQNFEIDGCTFKHCFTGSYFSGRIPIIASNIPFVVSSIYSAC